MEERRRFDDKNWDEIKKFIEESRTYRATDEIKQNYQVDSIDNLNTKVAIQNGRVAKLEEWRNSVEGNLKNKKDSQATTQSVITVIATLVMALSAVAMFFKH